MSEIAPLIAGSEKLTSIFGRWPGHNLGVTYAGLQQNDKATLEPYGKCASSPVKTRRNRRQAPRRAISGKLFARDCHTFAGWWRHDMKTFPAAEKKLITERARLLRRLAVVELKLGTKR
jgi:hypothetical protein